MKFSVFVDFRFVRFVRLLSILWLALIVVLIDLSFEFAVFLFFVSRVCCLLILCLFFLLKLFAHARAQCGHPFEVSMSRCIAMTFVSYSGYYPRYVNYAAFYAAYSKGEPCLLPFYFWLLVVGTFGVISSRPCTLPRSLM